METNKESIKLPKNFFTKSRPHVTKKEPKEDNIPFIWSSNIQNNNKKIILYSVKEKTIK